jgi:uncharacterized RDD family membrane protein YckC
LTRDDEYDAFGRPIERREEESEAAPLEPARPPSAERGGFAPPGQEGSGGFLPPTEQAPERDAWWAEAAPPAPAGFSPSSGQAAGESAEWLERVGAAVIDGLIRIAIVVFVVIVAAVATSADEDALSVAALLSVWLVAPFYAPILMARWDGQTVGHKAVGTRIVNRDGSRTSGGKAVVREVLAKGILIEFIGAVVTFGILMLVNYLWPLWDDKNEALHDKMCNTRVVKA